MKIRKLLKAGFVSVVFFLSPLYLSLMLLLSLYVRVARSNPLVKPRFVFGPVPIMNNVYWSKAIKSMGYRSETYTIGFYSQINSRDDWDVLLDDKYRFIPIQNLKYFFAFAESLFRYDIFVIPMTGFFLGLTPLARFEAYFLMLAGKKTIVMPYGSDSYSYRNIRSTSLINGLLMSYPQAARNQKKVANRVDYWCRFGSVVFTGFMGPDGFGRWDVVIPSVLFIDQDEWSPSSRSSRADGKNAPVFIAHAPNHRGFKGSEFVMAAVDKLKQEGLQVELILIEGLQNNEVRKLFECEVDILVEQLIATGHGLTGLEGMISALPTISNLEDEAYILPFRRWSYFDECPLVSATPENITDVLRQLITNPDLRQKLGKAGREYAQKYHSLDSAQYLYGEIIKYLRGEKDTLMTLYHPLLGEYKANEKLVDHPLTNNHIAE